MFTSKFNKLKLWQKIIVAIVTLYIVKYLIDALKLTAILGSLVAVKNQIVGETESFESVPTLTCTMYYTTWCGYCKKAKPHWDNLIGELNKQTINGKKIVVTKIDCDEHPEIAKQQNITGYPTFKFNLDGTYLDYSGGHTFEEFKQFIKSVV